jgi:hypothetical protein
MMRISSGAIVVLVAASMVSATQEKPPVQIIIKLAWIESPSDVWEEVREVDDDFKALGDAVVRLAKGLESEDIDARAKVASKIRELGLPAYGAIKGVRDDAASATVKSELSAVMAALAGDSARGLTTAPSARKMSAKAGAALLKRLEGNKVVTHLPHMVIKNATACTCFVGDEVPVETGRVIKIPHGEGDVRVEKETSIQKRGFGVSVFGDATDLKERKLSLDITATAYGPMPAVKAEKVSASLNPSLASGEHYLAGPFPAPDEKGNPWWILVEAQVIKRD